MTSLRARLDNITGGAAVAPLMVLFGLNLVDELDRIAFGILGPEIGDTFGISDGAVIVIATLVGIFTLVAALPLAYMGDRYNRVRLVIFAALAWSIMSALTGLAGWAGMLGLLVIARILAGIGRVANEPIHASLLADYYKPDVLPRVFAVHRFANPLSNGTAIAIGALAAVLDWQATFLLLSIPTALLIASALRLREPVRGESLDEAVALEADRHGGVPFAEARRQLFAIGSYKRLLVGAAFLGFGFIPLASFVIFFFDNVYNFDTTQRGLVSFVAGCGLATGLVVGQRFASRVEAGSGGLARITGLAFVAGAVGLLLMALAPWALLSIVFVFVANVGFAAWQPAYYPLISVIVPPRVRTQAYGYSLIIVGLGGLTGAIVVGGLGDSAGYRVAIGVCAIVVAIAGFVGSSASRFVARDREQAERSMAAALELQRELSEHGSRALLICRGVEVAYDQVQVLFGVDLEVAHGECVALLGTNGAGKSTLLRAISGTQDPIGGAIYFDGRDITHADGGQTTALGVIQVPGGKAVFPTLTVNEHLRAAGWLYRGDPAYLKAATEDVLQTFPRLRERIDQMAGNLSGGEQQMLALGMAFIAKPKLLMIDELSLGLAPTIVEQLLGIVRRIQQNGTAIVLVEQSINVALTVADRAYFLEKGEVRFQGPTEELLARNDIVRSVFLEGASSVSGNGETNSKTNGKTKAAPALVARSAPVELTPILELRSVTKRFGGIRAVDDTTFTLHEGEILGLIGPNGAGKTTIFDLVSGFLVADEGRIDLAGEDVTAMAPDRRAWLGLGRSFQDARLAGSLTVAENIALGLERHLDVRDHFASLLNLPGVVAQEEDVAWSVHDLIELMNLGAFRDKFVRELSTGSRRIVDLAMCIAHDPNVLLLDEPSSGIAQAETEALGPLLQRIQVETGCALLVIEHDMPLITAISDRMIALELGHPIVTGTPQEVIRHPRVVESYLGGDPSVINRSGAATTRKKTQAPGQRQQQPRQHERRVGEHEHAKAATAQAARRGRDRRGDRRGGPAVSRRRATWLAAVLLVVLGSSLGLDPVTAADSATVTDSGWWWRARANPDVPVPGPPNVKDGQLLVQGAPDGATALAAVAARLPSGQANPTLTLTVAEGGDTGGAQAVVLACQAGSPWTGGSAKAWAERPQPACESGVAGTRAADGKKWTFPLSSMQFGDQLSVVIVPGKVDGQPEGANNSVFSLVFEKPAAAAVTTTAGLAPIPPSPGFDASGSSSGFDVPTSGSGGDFSLPSDGGSIDVPTGPVAALPSDQQGLTPVAPVIESQTRLPIVAPLDPRSPHAQAIGIIILLAGAAFVWHATQRQPVIAADGTGPVGGLGRFARPRLGPPPSLRG